MFCFTMVGQRNSHQLILQKKFFMSLRMQQSSSIIYYTLTDQIRFLSAHKIMCDEEFSFELERKQDYQHPMRGEETQKLQVGQEYICMEYLFIAL